MCEYYIYIYIYRERESGRERYVCVSLCIILTYIIMLTGVNKCSEVLDKSTQYDIIS